MKKYFIPILILLLMFYSISKAENLNIKAANLKCEYRTNPLGIDVKNPRLSWIPQSNVRGQRQTAYHLIVASTKEYLK
ncbi:MAG: glycoside hydrolase family 78 protein, partial [Planctomycetota bacterium]